MSSRDHAGSRAAPARCRRRARALQARQTAGRGGRGTASRIRQQRPAAGHGQRRATRDGACRSGIGWTCRGDPSRAYAADVQPNHPGHPGLGAGARGGARLRDRPVQGGRREPEDPAVRLPGDPWSFTDGLPDSIEAAPGPPGAPDRSRPLDPCLGHRPRLGLLALRGLLASLQGVLWRTALGHPEAKDSAS